MLREEGKQEGIKLASRSTIPDPDARCNVASEEAKHMRAHTHCSKDWAAAWNVSPFT